MKKYSFYNYTKYTITNITNIDTQQLLLYNLYINNMYLKTVIMILWQVKYNMKYIIFTQ